MNRKPYTGLIPAHVTWFRDRIDWGLKNRDIAPSNILAPIQFWSDTTINPEQLQRYGVTHLRYMRIARDASGKPKLCAIDSPEFYATYAGNNAVIETYREFRAYFPFGVLYLETMSVPVEQAATVNVDGGNGQVRDYPIELPSWAMLIEDLDTKEAAFVHYQDFIKAMRAKPLTADQKYEAVARIMIDSKRTVEQKLADIRVVVV